ncbi:hypothetical protein A3Q56_02056 [Intoshia linei]|uniref:Major facilitator superfamily (MFS) profile domain-containing protein n=1 Tax=Intoshia linei TaxID=1819745 RepID=A0A177B9Q2_9BILA|nr:hypothetical protein A3Q56_02056 [Intoshia linei]
MMLLQYFNCTKTRSPLLTILCIISIPFLLGFVFNPSNVAVLIFMIIVMGLVVGGPNVLISSAVSVHISSDKNKIKDVSAVTGFLDGIGSTCVGIIQAIIPLIIEKYDWSGVFIVFLTLQILSLITLLYIVKMDKVWKIFVKDKHLSI